MSRKRTALAGHEILAGLSTRSAAVGEQTAFYGNALGSTVDAVRRYPGEVLRLIAVLGMGTGALAVIGGTVVIIGFLTLTTGALIAVQGYNTLSNVGIEALTGFLGAFLNVRFIVPATAGVALAATIGAGATAQLGAMRINEEIDALEAMAIRPITYLASTRIVAGVRGGHPDLHRRRADGVSGDPVRYDNHLRAIAAVSTTTTSRRFCTRPTCCGRSPRRCRWQLR